MMERSLLEAFNYMNETNYTTLEEIKQKYTEFEILDCWLMYEGIHGYTDRILEILRKIRFGERTEHERKISETSALMMQCYNDMVQDGTVYDDAREKVKTAYLKHSNEYNPECDFIELKEISENDTWFSDNPDVIEIDDLV